MATLNKKKENGYFQQTRKELEEKFIPLLEQAIVLSERYDVVVTNSKLTLSVKETITVTAEGQTITTTIYTSIVFAAHK